MLGNVSVLGKQTLLDNELSDSPLPPWHLFLYQMKWHATVELQAVHSLFKDKVQQPIMSML